MGSSFYVKPYTLVLHNVHVEEIGGINTCRSASWAKRCLRHLNYDVKNSYNGFYVDQFAGTVFIEFGSKPKNLKQAAAVAKMFELRDRGHFNWYCSKIQPGLYGFLATENDMFMMGLHKKNSIIDNVLHATLREAMDLPLGSQYIDVVGALNAYMNEAYQR